MCVLGGGTSQEGRDLAPDVPQKLRRVGTASSGGSQELRSLPPIPTHTAALVSVCVLCLTQPATLHSARSDIDGPWGEKVQVCGLGDCLSAGLGRAGL